MHGFWVQCGYCNHSVYGQNVCYLCQALLDHDATTLAKIGELMRIHNMEPHAAAYAIATKEQS